MAAEVPVSDLLCEAMEYLSKLGANLRTRSENLKEKRICKNKLRNAHAVHKAAKKVLLICELSKKSLENVETGVRKVLSIVDASQAPSVSGGKITDKKKQESKHRFYHFEFQSYKLRISKKIPLKHYMSAKVLANSMPASMLEKYPVFYDCKLKRRRRSEIQKSEGKIENVPKHNYSDINQDSDKSSVNQKVQDTESDISGIVESKENKETDKRIEHMTNNPGTQKLLDVSANSEVEDITSKILDTSISLNTLQIRDHNSQCESADIAISTMSSDDPKTKSQAERVMSNKNIPQSDHNESSLREIKKDRDISGKNSDGEHNLSKIEHKNKLSKKLKDNTNSGKQQKEEAIIRKKLSRIRIIDDSSESGEESLKKKVDTICQKGNQSSSENESKSKTDTYKYEPRSKKMKLTDMDDSQSKGDSDNEILESKNCEKDLDEQAKPLIRCVNITKLLKSDVLDTKIKELPNDAFCNRDKLLVYKNKRSINYNKEQSKLIEDENVMEKKNDDEFWTKKRKEVKQFKPKQFTVNIERLPHLTVNYLQIHNLTKIIHGCKTICGIKEKDKGLENLEKKIKKVKHALLTDSGSDDCENAISSAVQKVKNSLLNDSDSEIGQCSGIQNSNHPIQESLTDHAAIKDALLNDSDSDKNGEPVEAEKSNNHIQKSLTDTAAIKDALLNDSDSDKNGEQVEVENRNHPIKETLTDNAAIKDALLNDSDSDNGEQVEEENSNHPIKKSSTYHAAIKDALLNDSDSDKHGEQVEEGNSNHPIKETLTDNAAIKDALLNDSDSDNNGEQVEEESSNHPIKKSLTDHAAKKDVPVNFSDSDMNGEQFKEKRNLSHNSGCLKELEQGDTEKNKNNSLYDSDSDTTRDKEDYNKRKPTPQENVNDDEGEPIGGSAEDDRVSLNNKDNNVCNAQSEPKEQDESTKDTVKIKTSQLNDSSDTKSESSVIKRKKRKFKLPKHKRKRAEKSLKDMKNLLYYSSSSENEKEHSQEPNKDSEKQRNKTPSSSSSTSSHDIQRKQIKKVLQNSISHKKYNAQVGDSDSEDKASRSSDQVDGTADEHSNSSASKMVRSKAKPSGSSCQNSDTQDASDKDIDGLTNLNNLNKTHRRRDSTSTNNTGSRSSTKRNSRSKPTPMIGEDLLHAESSSEASEDEHGDEDLPSVQLSGLNGDSIGHLAKEDLLGESDSSVSQDKEQSEDTQNIDDSEEEENVKLKRRKANAILSDSDGVSSRRKNRDQDVRLSDFEDSEDESTESIKRSKRKKKDSESDASVGSSDDAGKKKRRRIKQVNDSDVSGSDSENDGRNKHGRKNIRKVMGKNQLEEATKKAAREEKERIARISERQKLYNNLEFDESGKPDEVVLEKVVLDFDPETKEPLIEVDRGLVKKLKPHQANGIKFMWDACFESVKRIKKDRGSGCILAHCMGLGKTLQVISLTHTLLIHGSLTGVNRVLVVCPLSTVLNWVNEFRMWLKHAHSEFEVDIYELSRYKQNSERAFQLQQWVEGGGVCVLGYEMFRNLSADNNKKFKKKMLRSFQESLVDPGPDLVVCDEGHLLKNEKTSLSQSMNRVRTYRRIVLTGTPLQNNLKEYYCMVQFVKPNLLGKYNEYLNRFVNPITNGQYTDSTEHDIKIMKRRSHVLHKMLDGAVQRRDYGVLAPFLPPKHEYVLFITLSDVQVKLYQFYLDNYSRRPLPGKSSGFLFPDFQSLQRIWTHPLVLKYNSERYEIMQQKKREREEEDSEGSLVDFIDDDSTAEESSTEESTDDLSDDSDDSRKKSKKKKSAKKNKGKDSKGGARRGTRANPVEVDDDVPEVGEVVEVRNENPTEWWIKLVEEEELDDMRNSHKLVLLFDILRQCETIGDKLLVFSQSLYSLDLIEHFLGKVDEATQEGRIDEKLGGHVGSWSPGVDYFRLDGSTSCENRSIWCKNFNREDNPRARLFLISTRAGGLGINLVAANRVVIFDVSWNPSHDVQSIFRVYRFGQKKPCYVYRFLAMGTMEEKIYERQVTKQAISKRVIDEQQIDRHYAENDLAELYKFEARPSEARPLPTLPKDRLFAEMLREHEAQIYKYHEHDSLLENKEEETLSEEERKAAWEDFENEKNKPPPAPFPSPWPMHNGMVPGLIAQQQQQLAYAALAAMLRKDMPNINDNQIRDMLPLIYNSNPGLMQKMSEIYKYTQPGMMNPAMMNPVMNPAASGGDAGAMGGSSGLQYEPPWQRQYQRQQQMTRLQQLNYQNQQMGAKFYAGGLGSRDPVAMALQQQRAREIMMGGGAGARPRGRPPHAPRAPAAPGAPQPHAPDVVDLDSD